MIGEKNETYNYLYQGPDFAFLKGVLKGCVWCASLIVCSFIMERYLFFTGSYSVFLVFAISLISVQHVIAFGVNEKLNFLIRNNCDINAKDEQ